MSVELGTPHLNLAEQYEDQELATGRHGEQVSALNGYMFTYVTLHELGYMYDSQTSFEILGLVGAKRPDVAFVTKDRLPNWIEGSVPLAPDLVIEGASPTDTLSGVSEKAQLYLVGGVKLVWVLDPYEREVRVYQPGAPKQTLGMEDELDGFEVVPGFKLPVRAVFERSIELKRNILVEMLKANAGG